MIYFRTQFTRNGCASFMNSLFVPFQHGWSRKSFSANFTFLGVSKCFLSFLFFSLKIDIVGFILKSDRFIQLQSNHI